MNRQTFIKEEMPKLEFFTSQILKVHGGHHPELADVRKEFILLRDKISADANADVTPELNQLAQISNNFAVPADACQAYAATYQLLSEFKEIA
ncbi:hypothetical protein [Enterococcus timonensis]|uniref:hypothetical protein n=1 Tax=Enterococcus timonensis TaxID=1852364 RepID=UPI0008DA1206|nr:hypothetical protein [Enterococcus timonensis]